jgi:hypothetical protein
LERYRLALWAFLPAVVRYGWDSEHRIWTDEDAAQFTFCLLSPRGVFARLLLCLAAASDQADPELQDQLRRCLRSLEVPVTAARPLPPSAASPYPGLTLDHDEAVLLGGQMLAETMGAAVHSGWVASTNWDAAEYGWGAEHAREFLAGLLSVRGPQARLLLTITDAERCQMSWGGTWTRRGAWRTTGRHRDRVSMALRRCLT